MMAEFNYFHPAPVVKHADKWANRTAHHYFSIVPACLYMIMRVGGRLPYLREPESIFAAWGNKTEGVWQSVCACVFLHSVYQRVWWSICWPVDFKLTHRDKWYHRPSLVHYHPATSPYMSLPIVCTLCDKQIYIFIVINFPYFGGGKGSMCEPPLINCVSSPPLLNRWGKYPPVQ